MTREIDLAIERDAAIQELVVATVVAKASQVQAQLSAFRDWDGVHCYDCHEILPAVRASAGRVRCVDCQTEVEQRARKGR